MFAVNLDDERRARVDKIDRKHGAVIHVDGKGNAKRDGKSIGKVQKVTKAEATKQPASIRDKAGNCYIIK
jgi:hypothetical protein